MAGTRARRARALRQGLLHARHRIVVGEREQLNARGGGGAHHLGGGEFAVGVQRVGLQVEGWAHLSSFL